MTPVKGLTRGWVGRMRTFGSGGKRKSTTLGGGVRRVTSSVTRWEKQRMKDHSGPSGGRLNPRDGKLARDRRAQDNGERRFQQLDLKDLSKNVGGTCRRK